MEIVTEMREHTKMVRTIWGFLVTDRRKSYTWQQLWKRFPQYSTAKVNAAIWCLLDAGKISIKNDKIKGLKNDWRS